MPAGSHPHDVAPAADGGVWYTGQRNGVLGHLDPATGDVREIPLGAGSAPHGVITGPDGAAWITDGGLNAIVRVDGTTDEVRAFPLPPIARAPTSTPPSSTRPGPSGSPASPGSMGGSIRRPARSPSSDDPEGRGPYGITTTPDGRSGTPRWPAATSRGSIRRPAPPRRRAADGRPGRPTGLVGLERPIWVSEWDAGQVGVHDPATGGWEEWRLPGAAPQAYAVFVDERDIVWLTDFGANAIVRFDPADRGRSTRSQLPSTPAPPCASCSAGPARSGAPNRRSTSWSSSPSG